MELHLLSLTVLRFFFLSLSHGLNPDCNIPDSGSSLQVFHVFSPCSPFRPSKPVSWEEHVLQMQAKDQARVQLLSSHVAGKSVVPIAYGWQIIQSPIYIVRANIGTPAQTMLMAVDTSNDAAWIPCTGCVGCGSTVFNPANSSSFKPVGCQAPQCKQVPNPTCGGTTCSFNLTYGGKYGRSTVEANLLQDSITLATDSIPDYTFGCIAKAIGSSVPPQGLLGLGRGPLSLLSQSQDLYQSTFSYCLPSFKSVNFSGSLKLGPKGQPIRIKSTPLLENPRRPSLYYVNLTAVRVGIRVVDIPPSAFAFDPTTGAGTIIDSGTVFTRLVKPIYTAVRDAYRRRVGVNLTVTTLGEFDTCYSIPIDAPTITLMFSGMNVTLPQENLLIQSTTGNITCLAMAASPDDINSNVNIIANMQQQNHRYLFDVPNKRLGVAREPCS
ncbi:aspartyl protease AED3-like [Mangifera indica]|uniref:aspartyl protease AED3-like n=1 Tax=Mangifera indica TaxID=29780 RepID=UPI001CFAB5B5|nr:aspartyl protease AED3-like [Mangifera indica]